MNQEILRQIPKMDKLMELPEVVRAGAGLPRTAIRTALQGELELLRGELLAGAEMPSDEILEKRMASAVSRQSRYRLCRLVNATGIVMHTNLGRAPLGPDMAAHVAVTAAGYSNLEYDLTEGHRGSRYDLIEQQLCRLTGAEAAMVVNNNAAAVFLMLHTLASDRRVAISRGELVEIGGAFRVPDIMAASGAVLLEIGTTNKTRLSDYAHAVEQDGAEILLKVHKSNFKMIGFSESAQLPELAELAAEHGVPLLYDLGAGLLVRPEELGLSEGCYVPDAVQNCDVCCFSGDKLFGGGQAGIVLGKKTMVEAMKKNQLARMLRVDKMTLASLEAALRWYEDPAAAKEKIPVLSMLSASPDCLHERADALADALSKVCPKCSFRTVKIADEPGGGSLPGVELKGYAVAVTGSSFGPDKTEAFLRSREVPVIARIYHDMLLLSLRTILPEDEASVIQAFTEFEAEL